MEIEKINPCKVKSRRSSSKIVFPAKIFGYLASCEQLRQRVRKVQTEAIPVYSGLPLVSSVTSKFSPQGVALAHWSFLRY